MAKSISQTNTTNILKDGPFPGPGKWITLPVSCTAFPQVSRVPASYTAGSRHFPNSILSNGSETDAGNYDPEFKFA